MTTPKFRRGLNYKNFMVYDQCHLCDYVAETEEDFQNHLNEEHNFWGNFSNGICCDEKEEKEFYNNQ